MRAPSRASISARRRGIVQLRRSATGCSSNGVATRKAASLFTAGGPGAMLAFSASTPLAAKALRHRRTVSSRTPNASAISGLVQAASVKSTARARSASPRSRELARAKRAARCSPLAVTGDFPAMPHASRIDGASQSQKKPIRWLTKQNLLRARIIASSRSRRRCRRRRGSWRRFGRIVWRCA